VRTRDLTPTFGSALGAQLVDVYVRRPDASSTSIQASFAQRNYSIAAAGRGIGSSRSRASASASSTPSARRSAR
jgi:hypothetical protein